MLICVASASLGARHPLLTSSLLFFLPPQPDLNLGQFNCLYLGIFGANCLNGSKDELIYGAALNAQRHAFSWRYKQKAQEQRCLLGT